MAIISTTKKFKLLASYPLHGKLLGNIKMPQILQERIAVLLIGGAFIVIIVILGIHSYDVSVLINKIPDGSATSDTVNSVNNANLNVFSIILSLFGAWVGAVLAFYFGSQSLDKAYSSLSQAQSSIDKIVSDNRLAEIKVEEIIGKNPDSMKLLKVKLDWKIDIIVRTAEERNYQFVMVTDDTQNKVLGLLFISDLSASKSKADLISLDETLEKFLTDNEITDTITKRRWMKDGVTNFVAAGMEDSLNTIVDKMKQLNESLSVRAVVMDKGVPVATITYDMISKEIRK